MSENKVVLGLVGSPNKVGRTNELVSAALEGASRAGAATELIQDSDCYWCCKGHRFCYSSALCTRGRQGNDC